MHTSPTKIFRSCLCGDKTALRMGQKIKVWWLRFKRRMAPSWTFSSRSRRSRCQLGIILPASCRTGSFRSSWRICVIATIWRSTQSPVGLDCLTRTSRFIRLMLQSRPRKKIKKRLHNLRVTLEAVLRKTAIIKGSRPIFSRITNLLLKTMPKSLGVNVPYPRACLHQNNTRSHLR